MGRLWHSNSHCSITPLLISEVLRNTKRAHNQPALSWREHCYVNVWHSVCKLHTCKASEPTSAGCAEGINFPCNRRCRSRRCCSMCVLYLIQRITMFGVSTTYSVLWQWSVSYGVVEVRFASWLCGLTDQDSDTLLKGHERPTYQIFLLSYRYQSNGQEGIPSGVWLLAKKA